MIKKTILLFTFGITIISNAQQTLLSFKNDLKTSSSFIKDVIPVVNTENDEIAFFVADAKNVYGYKIDANFKIVSKIISEEKRRKFKTLIGSSASKNGSYRVFLTNKNQDDFASVNFSFKDGKTSFKEFSIAQNEKFIQTVTSNNQFYLIAGARTSNQLFIYSFDEQGNFSKNRIDISGLRFINKDNRHINLLNLLVKSENLNKFDENTPNSIQLTSEQRKMYVRDHTILITFDHHKTYTQILEIDLNSLTADSFQFKKPKLGEKSKRTNSYLNGNNLFTLATTKNEFTVEILDFETGDLLKKYGAKENEEIDFKNTGIIQKGGMYNGNRDLEKTKRFLRRIAKGDTGLSVRKVNNNYHLTIGGYIVQKSPGMMMPFGGIPIGSIGAVTVFFNPAQLAFNSFSNSKTTTIESLLDENFEHVKGEIQDNAFDKMLDYKSDNKGETVFKYKDFYIKTRYSKISKSFNFKKFTD